jgi:hypothetical protein
MVAAGPEEPQRAGQLAPLVSHAFKGFFDAPERTRTSTDHTVHEALNQIRPAYIGPRSSSAPSLRGFVGAVDGSGAVDVLSAESDSLAVFAMVLGVLAVVLALDVAVFRGANSVSAHLDESRMLVTEKIFGVLLAALAVQLILDGLHSDGVIHLISD